VIAKRLSALLCAIALSAATALSQTAPMTAQVAGKAPMDSVAAKAQADSLFNGAQFHVIKKEIAVADQVRIGTTIMVFIIVVMSFMNNFNPE
jgi:hypothetical protein